jgi:hypothetical protein
MKIMHLGIAVWPSWNIAAQKMWLWRQSIDRFSYRFFYYGVGTTQWPGYRAQKVESQLDHLLKYGWRDCTHILYTDCCDCLMLAPAYEIVTKYKLMGCPPMLVSGAEWLGNVDEGLGDTHVSDERYPIFSQRSAKRFRYPQVGGYIMEAELLVWFLTKIHEDYKEYGDECFAWYDMIQKGEWNPVIDEDCQIFQCHGEDVSEVIDIGGIKRIRNKVTGTNPCIFHDSGGYASQDDFKDYKMIPWAKRLGIVE